MKVAVKGEREGSVQPSSCSHLREQGVQVEELDLPSPVSHTVSRQVHYCPVPLTGPTTARAPVLVTPYPCENRDLHLNTRFVNLRSLSRLEVRMVRDRGGDCKRGRLLTSRILGLLRLRVGKSDSPETREGYGSDDPKRVSEVLRGSRRGGGHGSTERSGPRGRVWTSKGGFRRSRCGRKVVASEPHPWGRGYVTSQCPTSFPRHYKSGGYYDWLPLRPFPFSVLLGLSLSPPHVTRGSLGELRTPTLPRELPDRFPIVDRRRVV